MILINLAQNPRTLYFLFRIKLLAATIALVGCASGVKTTQVIPPKVPEAAEIRRVAVMGFRGNNAKEVETAFEAALVSHRLDGQPYFTVADREKQKEVAREHLKTLQGDVDSSTAVSFGKQIGVKGIYFGDVKKPQITNSRFNMKQSYCKRYNPDGKCKEQGWKSVSCRKTNVSITIIPRLINVETGQVAYRATKIGRSESSACGGESVLSRATLVDKAITDSLIQIIRDIAPIEVLVTVALMEEPSVLEGKKKVEFVRGLTFSEAGRMDRGCQIWRDLNMKVRNTDPALLYNVAICEELNGEYKSALYLMEQVARQLQQPDKRVNNALMRLRTSAEAQQANR